MILTCPECATSYFVDEARIPPDGRKVKCTSCGARWTARREDEPEEDIFDALEADPGPPPEAPAAAEEPAEAEAPEDDLVVTGPEPEALRPRPEAAARRVAATKAAQAAKARRSRGLAIAFGGLAALVVALVAAALAFRQDIVRLWPQSSAAFAGAGVNVAPAGLVIEGVAAKPTFVDGRPALEVTGAIRNTQQAAASAPPLRLALLDRAGKPVAAKIGRPVDASIPAGGKRHFAMAIVDPPSEAHDLEVTFEAGGGAAVEAAAGAAKPVNSSGHEPVEAKPLAPSNEHAAAHHG